MISLIILELLAFSNRPQPVAKEEQPANMSDDPMNMFAGIKKKKKKQVNIAELDVEDGAGEPEPQAPFSPAPTPVAGGDEGADDDAVRPLEKDANLTLKEDDPLDFSDLKKKKKKKQVAIDLEEVATPEEQEQRTNIAANVDKLGNTAEAEVAEGCVGVLLHCRS